MLSSIDTEILVKFLLFHSCTISWNSVLWRWEYLYKWYYHLWYLEIYWNLEELHI